jgi:hypothetical protein
VRGSRGQPPKTVFVMETAEDRRRRHSAACWKRDKPGENEPRRIVGAAGLHSAFLVQGQLFAHEQILRGPRGRAPSA